jgi:hypothetical protein
VGTLSFVFGYKNGLTEHLGGPELFKYLIEKQLFAAK